MSGPIHSITIDPGSSPPPSNRFHVTITLPVWIDDIPEGVTLEQVAKLLTHDQWNEGRYPFRSELIHEGLKRELYWAIREALEERLQSQYGNETVPYKSECGHGEIARWHDEAEKIKGPYVEVCGHVKAAKIERECDECRGKGHVEKQPATPYWTEHGDREQEPCPRCNGTGVIGGGW